MLWTRPSHSLLLPPHVSHSWARRGARQRELLHPTPAALSFTTSMWWVDLLLEAKPLTVRSVPSKSLQFCSQTFLTYNAFVHSTKINGPPYEEVNREWQQAGMCGTHALTPHKWWPVWMLTTYMYTIHPCDQEHLEREGNTYKKGKHAHNYFLHV